MCSEGRLSPSSVSRSAPSSVQCWGLNNNGQLGYGDNVSRGDLAANMGVNLPSVDYGPGSSPVALESGYLHTCTLMSTDSIKVMSPPEAG